MVTPSRITLDMTREDVVIALSEGNPGAIGVCMELLQQDGGGAFDLLYLDVANIYGSHIWLAYKDVCNCDIGQLKAMLRAQTIKEAVEALPDYRRGA